MNGTYGLTRGCNFDTELCPRFTDFEDSDTSCSADIYESCSSNNEAETRLAVKQFVRNAPSHLLIVALLEHICKLYDTELSNKELFQALCSQLSAIKVIPPFATLDEFTSVRNSYRIALDDFMSLVINATQQKTVNRIEKPLWQDRSRLLCSSSRYKEEFEEIELLGEGGFGCVFEVRNKLDGRRYAIKKIKLTNFPPEDCLKVLREVKVLANLENTNVVRYYSAWLENSWTEDLKKSVSHAPISLFGKWHKSRIEASLTSRSSVSDSVVFATLSKETSFRKESGILPNECFALGSHQNTSEKFVHRYTLQNQGCLSAVENEGKTELSGEYGQAIVKRAVPLGSQRVNHGNSYPVANNVLFMKEQINNIALVVHIQMELCSTTLKDWISKRNNDVFYCGTKVEMSANVEIFKQLLLGVHYLHNKGVIHRDLKPCNIFLSTNCDSGEIMIKIGDFGLARTMESNTDNRVTSNEKNFKDNIDGEEYQFATKGIGTCIYAAPEQVLTHSYTFKADIYSLGIILFELLVPFKTGMERHSLLKELRDSRLPESLAVKWPDMSELVRKMTDVNPSKRPTASTLLTHSYFNDKDMIIRFLRLELAEKSKEIAKLKEILHVREVEFEKLQN